MSLKRLTTAEMIQVSSPWVTEGDPAHALIKSNGTLMGVLSALTEGCRGLYAVLPPEGDERAEELMVKARELDAEHDDLVRLLYGALGQIALTEADGDAILAIRDTLFPQGLQHTQLSYRGQAGHAKLAEAKLAPEHWERLSSAKFGSTDARTLTERWFRVAQQLGDVEQQRARLRAPEIEPPLRANDARFRWIRAVNALIAMAALAELGEEDDHLLFSELRLVEATADGRARRASGASAELPEAGITTDAGTGAGPAVAAGSGDGVVASSIGEASI